MNPNVLAVGAIDQHRSFDSADWTVADFANHGTAERSPDVAMPGVSVLGLRVDGSFAATFFPGGLVGDRFIRGSGTSQAAALTSGMAALLLSQNPRLTPADVKATMMESSRQVGGATEYQGAGVLDASLLLPTLLSLVTHLLTNVLSLLLPPTPTTTATGTGSLAATRGTSTLMLDGVPLDGDVDVFGRSFSSTEWAQLSASRRAWVGGTWLGATMAGYDTGTRRWSTVAWVDPTWTGEAWADLAAEATDTWNQGTWSGSRWSSGGWSSDSWQGSRWSGSRWSGSRWSGSRWSDADWSGSRWSGSRWSGSRWSGSRWSGSRWSNANWSSAGWQ